MGFGGGFSGVRERTSRDTGGRVGSFSTLVKLFVARTDGCLCNVILSLIQAFRRLAILFSLYLVLVCVSPSLQLMDFSEVIDDFDLRVLSCSFDWVL